MGVCWESSLASLPREPPMSIGGIIIKIYCAARYFGYGDDRCLARFGKVLFELYEMAGAMIKKLFMSFASSVIGTGTVLGVNRRQCRGSTGCWMPRWAGYPSQCGQKSHSLKLIGWCGAPPQTN